MALFAQLTYRESLRGIETCLSARPAVAYRMGFRGRVTRTNLAYANDHRDWRVFAAITSVLMRRAQRLYVDTPPELGLEADLFALNATVIELEPGFLDHHKPLHLSKKATRFYHAIMTKSKHSTSPALGRSAGVYQQLKEMILTGHLSPGQRLVERELANQMKVSRIPLRESLICLESEGLVRSVANTATFVEDFSPQDLMEILSLRLVLEPLAARMAALRTTAELVRSLRQICERMTQFTKAGNWKKLDQVDYEFHRTTVEASQHRRLIRAYDFSQIRILGRGGPAGSLKELPPDYTAEEHLPIVDCIERGDAIGAERVNYKHVEKAMQGFQVFYGFIVQHQKTPVHGQEVRIKS